MPDPVRLWLLFHSTVCLGSGWARLPRFQVRIIQHTPGKTSTKTKRQLPPPPPWPALHRLVQKMLRSPQEDKLFTMVPTLSMAGGWEGGYCTVLGT